MIGRLIKLAVVALVLYGVWQVGSSYWTFYAFQDELQQAAQFAGPQSDDDLRARVLEIAGKYRIPLGPDAVSIRKEINQVLIEAVYTAQIEVLPRYRYPKEFRARAKAWSVRISRLQPLTLDFSH